MNIKIISKSLPPVTCFLPVEDADRLLLKLRYFQIKRLDLDSIDRFNLRKEDLVMVCEDWSVRFSIDENIYTLKVFPGLIFDGASVPKGLVQGGLTKNGQHIEEASLVHDILFNGKLLPFEVANEVFRAMIRHVGLTSKFDEFRYMLGVRSPVGRILYNANKIKGSWMNEYYSFTRYKDSEKAYYDRPRGQRTW